MKIAYRGGIKDSLKQLELVICFPYQYATFTLESKSTIASINQKLNP